ncbi:tRNA(Met) cytidine acetyltransferase TmcA [Paramixta manurensis]|uniref:tRNA(Met) cytidine acetyltransferase TmcA n=1 Tax=Paramixta manurensis TaxID=2740817 RepID=A0A6M8UF17_9GAMM|nr:tRNA(Met) cytidine acetyltransferase TmcA [Erwiniaceae bacterium PD-1]
MAVLERITAEMQRKGVRCLLVISGEPAWCYQQVMDYRATLPGDWLWVGESPEGALHCQPGALRTLLGREFRHAIFDARSGFHAEAFAALAGTLTAGSWLMLLVPEWSGWSQQPDSDSLRWSECDTPIITPHFIRHLQRHLQQDRQVAIHRQGEALALPSLANFPLWRSEAEQQQQAILQALLTAAPGISVLTAPRGRGKSALAGMLAAHWPGTCWVTAPAKTATDVLARFAGEAFQFIAPDALLAQPPNAAVDWLLVDEAAAIPAPLLQRMVQRFPRVLLTTTVQGYEGTGRGFLLKFCASLSAVRFYQLDQPLRWASADPLETVVDRSLIFAEPPHQASAGRVSFIPVEQQEWQTQPQRLTALYQLLASAHYRTSPLDLRRMMDAPGMHFIAAQSGPQQVCGALWLVDEGELSPSLAEAVWAGRRRPRGNLVAQSLAAHGGFPEAATLRSRRLSRIAISADKRRQGIGKNLVATARQAAEGIDFLSVSFGFTGELWQFWRACGFTLVRMGTQREASSGCYTAMALLPLSAAGERLAGLAAHRLARDLYWLQHWLPLPLPLEPTSEQRFNDDDWQELSGFAFAFRPFEASLAALARMLAVSEQPLPALRLAITERQPVNVIAAQLMLSGRKALQMRWRQETAEALLMLDKKRAEQARQRLASLQ